MTSSLHKSLHSVSTQADNPVQCVVASVIIILLIYLPLFCFEVCVLATPSGRRLSVRHVVVNMKSGEHHEGIFFKFSTNVHFDSQMNRFDLGW